MNLALLGYGRFGKHVARALARVGELAVICDPHTGRQEEAIRAWGDWSVRVTGFTEDAFRMADAVWIATPTGSHEMLAREALDAGCHVLCEKPVVRTLDTAADLVDLARSKELLLMGGFLGIRTGCHAALADETRPRELDIIRRNTEASLSDGDVLYGLGPHDVASALALLDSVPDSVVASGNDHRVGLTLVWQDFNAARVSIELDWLAEERERAVYKSRDRSVNYAELPNPIEPLLKEAQEFIELAQLDPAEHEPEHQLVLGVTEVLERAHLSLKKVPV